MGIAFYLDLNKAMIQAYRILKKYKYFCVVIGNRTVKKVKLPTDFIVSELGENLGFHTIDIIVRNIPNKHMPLKNSPTNVTGKLQETMQKESIVILQKQLILESRLSVFSVLLMTIQRMRIVSGSSLWSSD